MVVFHHRCMFFIYPQPFQKIVVASRRDLWSKTPERREQLCEPRCYVGATCRGRHWKEESQHRGGWGWHPWPCSGDAREQCAKETDNEQGIKDLCEGGFTEYPKLAVLKEEPQRGLQCLHLWSKGERARQLFLASSLHMKWRRESLTARDMERQLIEGESNVRTHPMFFRACFSDALF